MHHHHHEADPEAARVWARKLAPYGKAENRKAATQLANTLIPFAFLWWAMYRSLEVGYWLTLLLAVPTAFLLIRAFILQHDCGHGSFTSSRKANDRIGAVLGVLTLTPYEYWKKAHAIHHATAGNLDRRFLGDVDTMTVQEYLDATWWERLLYRAYRNPIVMFVIGPVWVFFIKHRAPIDIPPTWKRAWASVLWTDLALACLWGGMAWLVGWKAFLMVQLPIHLIAGPIGIWLFYVQHQYEDTYWEHEEDWDFFDAGLAGSSYYDLPGLLHWLTGNIGIHHIHHVASHIPNYRLQEAFEAHPGLQRVTRITFLESLGCIHLKLWDESRGRLVGWSGVRRQASG